MQVGGGVGINKNLYVGSNTYTVGNSSITGSLTVGTTLRVNGNSILGDSLSDVNTSSGSLRVLNTTDNNQSTYTNGALIVDGGLVKFQRMQEEFPNSPRRFNVLYMVSSQMPYGGEYVARFARGKGARIVWNQNGVAYPSWYGRGWEQVNEPMARLHADADYVFYQSQFCKLSADRFLGERRGPWEILYNSVDTKLFTPAASNPDPDHLVLLLGGTQYQYYHCRRG